ncbi:uncharacterized protein CLUP02_13220 [Colletotrichum lupini]|uniref:Alpha-ketoglutarate-dependent sulfonate dioxygenase n=1 Tax=Colletotrichum lupini TaxID=145971 RepID=A0A9Q8T3V7_9PEZI|nr:uncharacterized protein CLUP02_13220 [Colletotrichum lupini]UQC87701.1 hypothetical protein CLUP02_13220 [Colletotrichum lupini]
MVLQTVDQESETANLTMPSFFKRSSKAKEKEAEEEKAKADRPATPPPAYGTAPDEPPPFEDQPPPFEANGGPNGKRPHTEQDVANLTSAFNSLRLGTQRDPDVDSCLAHLKLLYAIETLKEDVGYSDGLWDLWDSRAGPRDGDEGSSKGGEERVKEVLSALREKRWAVYLARAADRYQTWWKTLSGGRLREAEMKDFETCSDKYLKFPDGGEDFLWTVNNLPPLDVLIMFHAHMLNPRAFLEDTMRWNLREFWTTGMPWAQVNQVIDSKFNYEVSDVAKSNWEKATGRAWNNLDEPLEKAIECPACKQTTLVPWSTCGLPEMYKGQERPGLVGKGYGDGDFSQLCTAGCNTVITHRLLCVAKMINDAELYLNEGVTLPSTILDPKVGMPVATEAKLKDVTYPNRLIGQGISAQLLRLISPGQAKTPTMKDVRDLVSAALADDDAFARIQGTRPAPYDKRDGSGGRVITRTERFQSRKMMSRYWENASIFALDLVGATMRQGVFIGKMFNIDWLHSPSARGTMDRLLQKYQRFMLIMTEYPMSFTVPTLDVDLAWHTHQLAPRAYYKFSTYNTAMSTSKEAKFIDHNDKIDEDQLSNSFELTSKTYLEKFNEVYSECTCWYCEAVRAKITIDSSSVFGKSKPQKAIDSFDKATASQVCTPSNSVHISAHNSVRTDGSATHNIAHRQLRLAWRMRLDDAYERAKKRAAKRGRTLPPKEEFYNNWGKTHHRDSPYNYPAYLIGGVYPAGNPGVLHGSWADCAQGLCGSNDIAAGGCGGPGGCTNMAGYWSGASRQLGGCAPGAGIVGMGSGGGCGGGGGGCGGGGG